MLRAIASTRVLIEQGIVPATIVVLEELGKIISIELSILSKDELLSRGVVSFDNVTPSVVMPGFVDSHVHLNEPGRTEWEGFATGTKAAAMGGVTTVVDMPLNAIPPTTDVSNFNLKLKAAEGQTYVDVAFWGGIIPGNKADLRPLIERGVRGFKGFMIESGVDEFPAVSPAEIEEAMAEVADCETLLMFHAEMDGRCDHQNPDHAPDDDSEGDPTEYDTFLHSRPDSFETKAIKSLINCMEKYPSVPTHIVHLATHEAVPMIRDAQLRGLALSAETCFHYLALLLENIPAKATMFKCCPPIRLDSNRLKLWQAVKDGVITTIVSDHSPCTPHLKGLQEGNFMTAWGGILSVGLGLSILNTVSRHISHSLSLVDISRLCSLNTAKQVGLSHCKGQLAVGYDADIIVFDPEASFRVNNADLAFKNKLTAYDGWKLKGMVLETIVRGKTVYLAKSGHSEQPFGRLLLDKRIKCVPTT